MKTTELKVEDWVFLEKRPVQIGDIENYFTRAINPQLMLPRLEPIPLTKEILEQNLWYLTKPYTYTRVTNRSFNFKIMVGEHHCPLYIMSLEGEEIWLMDIKYVHELQHILWALGIDDNLKV